MRRYFIDEAILNAEKSLLYKANHGALVIYRGKIVGRGFNKMCLEHKNKVNRWSIHAEVDAIQDALRKITRENLKKSIVLVVRLRREGDISLSAPCQDCANYIQRCGIRTCYYSDENYKSDSEDYTSDTTSIYSWSSSSTNSTLDYNSCYECDE